MATQIVVIMLVLLSSALIAHLIVFNAKPTKEFIERCALIKNAYTDVYKQLLQGKFDTIDEQKEVVYKGITIKYSSYTQLCDEFLKLINEAMDMYLNQDDLYKNNEEVYRIYLDLTNIQREVLNFRNN